jgi:hypothetical protein
MRNLTFYKKLVLFGIILFFAFLLLSTICYIKGCPILIV